VTFADLCPSIRDKARTFTPELMAIDAQICRRSCSGEDSRIRGLDGSREDRDGRRAAPNGTTVVGNRLKIRRTVGSETGRTVTIQFTDAGEKRWRRSSAGPLEPA
jgi:hypothetical protein